MSIADIADRLTLSGVAVGFFPFPSPNATRFKPFDRQTIAKPSFHPCDTPPRRDIPSRASTFLMRGWPE
ncbi:MAG: hypothetical protein ACLVB5_03320 [Christensenellales bacterium]